MPTDRVSAQTSEGATASEPAPLGFVILLSIAAVMTLAAALPGLRTVVLWLLTLPVRVVAWVLPGETLYENFQSASVVMQAVGAMLLLVGLIPLLYVVLVAVRAAGFAPMASVVSGLAPWMRTGARTAEEVCNGFGVLARWATLALVAVVVVVVAQRYVFGVAFTKLQEAILYLHAGVIMLGAAWTLGDDGHVRVDVIYGSLSDRAKAIVNLIGSYALLAPMCWILLTASGDYVDRAWRVGEGSPEADGIPLVYLLKTLIPSFAVLMLMQAGAIAARAALTLAGEEPGAHLGGRDGAHGPHEEGL